MVRLFAWSTAWFALAAVACAPSGQPHSACAAVEQVQIQGGGHLLGDRPPPVPYNSEPPTSGWHASGPPRFGVAAAPLSEPEQVNVLEQGGVVVAYRDLGADQVAELEALAREHPDTVALTSYGAIQPGEVALTAWGVLQHCGGLDTAAVEAFITTHAGASTHAH